VKPFIVSPHAADDLNGIWLYLAEEASEEIADRALLKLTSSFADLAQSPGIGHRRRDLTKLPVHFLFVEPYMVVYQRDRTRRSPSSLSFTARATSVASCKTSRSDPHPLNSHLLPPPPPNSSPKRCSFR
jgi:antitoxin ParD1/3/4/toxin ParE1/3/4